MCSHGRWNVTDAYPSAALRKPCGTPHGSFTQSPRPKGHDARTIAEATGNGMADRKTLSGS